MKRIAEKKNDGRSRCAQMRKVRCEMAQKNGIDYTPHECSYKGECSGTCPLCDAELKTLTVKINKKKVAAGAAIMAGVAAAAIGMTPITAEAARWGDYVGGLESQPTYEVRLVTAEEAAIRTVKLLALPVGVVAATAIVYGVSKKKKKKEENKEQPDDKLGDDTVPAPISQVEDDELNKGQQSTDSGNIAP